MDEVQIESKITKLEGRINLVAQEMELKYATKTELLEAVAQVSPVSRDEIKLAVVEAISDTMGKETREKRAWAIDLIKVVLGALGGGGIIGLVSLFLQKGAP